MRYRFIDDHRTTWPIEVQCRVLEVSRSGYYAWRRRPESHTARRQVELTDRIRAIHGQKHHAKSVEHQHKPFSKHKNRHHKKKRFG